MHLGQEALGLRTFLLISLIGAIAGGLENQWLSALLSVFALGLIVVSYFTQTNVKSAAVDRGLTTEFAAGVVFCLSFASHQSPALSALLGPVVAGILVSKKYLHRFTHAIKPDELKAAILLLLGGAVVIHLTPHRTIDPWGIFNPRKFGYLVLLLAALEFSGYALTKIIGNKKGAILVGFLGGFVSSTAVLLSASKQATRIPKNILAPLSSAFAAKLAALIEVLLIIGLVSPLLFRQMVFPILAGIAVGGLALILLTSQRAETESQLVLASPLDWKGVIRLSFTLAAILALVSITQQWAGDKATFIVSFLTGLFELHGTSLASATMHTHGRISLFAAEVSILLAMIGSLLAKIAMSWILHRGQFSRKITLIFLLMAAAIGIAGWVAVR